MTDPTATLTVEQRFTNEILAAIATCKRELNYHPHRWEQMIAEHGALGTTKIMLRPNHPITEGFTRLWELGRLDLTAEAIAAKPEYDELFTYEELGVAVSRTRSTTR